MTAVIFLDVMITMFVSLNGLAVVEGALGFQVIFDGMVVIVIVCNDEVICAAAGEVLGVARTRSSLAVGLLQFIAT